MAWVIDSPHRYHNDIFFRTTAHVVALQVSLIILSISFFALTVKIISSQITPVIFGLNISVVVFGVSVAGSIIAAIILSYVALRPARSALQSQKVFISNIAHELRTPLAVMKTLTEVELLEGDLEPSVRKTLMAILEEINRASGVINNVVSLNRLLRPKPLEYEAVHLGAIIDRVVARSGRVAFERGIEVLVHHAQNEWVYGNPVALEQMVINLANNALQYTPQHHRGRVTLTVRPNEHSGMTALSVADTGIGIAQNDLEHIFEPFYRGDKSRARNIKEAGTGMGLAIVSEIVQAHGGEIRANSTPGKGTTFTILLPTALPPETPTTPSQAD